MSVMSLPARATSPCRAGGGRLVRHLTLHRIEGGVLDEMAGSFRVERGQSGGLGIEGRCGSDDVKAGHVRVPAFETLRVLRPS